MRIRFTVSRKEAAPPRAFAATTEVIAAVSDVLRRQEVPDDAVQRSQLDLQTSWTHRTGQPEVDGYTCAATFTVESGDLDAVPRLLAALVDVGVHGIGGLEFDVADRDALREEASRRAVRAARRKAELYAETAGVRLGAVVHIEDVPVNQEPGWNFVTTAVESSSPAVLVPGHIEVSATVIVGFTITD